MLVLAEMISGDFSTALGQTIFFLILSAVGLLVLKIAVLGDNAIASDSGLRKRFVPRDDSFGPSSPAPGPSVPVRENASNHSQMPERGRDKRRSLRRRGNPIPVLISEVQNPAKPVQGLILDRSRGGLFLSIPQRIDAGSRLVVRTPDFPDAVASVELLVRHCKQKGQEWRIGCQFVEELPWSVLLLFG